MPEGLFSWELSMPEACSLNLREFSFCHLLPPLILDWRSKMCTVAIEAVTLTGWPLKRSPSPAHRIPAPTPAQRTPGSRKGVT